MRCVPNVNMAEFHETSSFLRMKKEQKIPGPKAHPLLRPICGEQAASPTFRAALQLPSRGSACVSEASRSCASSGLKPTRHGGGTKRTQKGGKYISFGDGDFVKS